MKKRVNAQAALEFLTTYGWAMLVVFITIGALYYFGVFDLAGLAPEQCDFGTQFECTAFVITDSAGDDVKVQLVNELGADIVVNSISIKQQEDTTMICTYSGNLPHAWPNGNSMVFNFTDCQDGNFQAGERLNTIVSYGYFSSLTPTQPKHNNTGKVSSRVGS